MNYAARTLFGIESTTFFVFIFRSNARSRLLYFGVTALLVQIVLFKILFPFADYFSDSYSFIQVAHNGDGFNIWPIGYSRFLAFFHFFTHSDTVVVVFQYLFLGLTSLYFFFVVSYLLPIGGVWRKVLFIFLVFNPLWLFTSNYISSDSLFTSISILWFCSLLWLMHGTGKWQLWLHGLFLILAFVLRYNAMYYPIISLLVFAMVPLPIKHRIIGIVMPLILVGIFVAYTRQQAYEATGERQFSVLSGWHWANNALYMYPFVDIDSTKMPDNVRDLDRMTRHYFDTASTKLKNMSPADGGFYIRSWQAPLKQYFLRYWREHEPVTQIQIWGAVAPTFSAYGKHLIKSNPGGYLRYYVFPNFVNYMSPPLEKLESYNMGADTVARMARKWFAYESNNVTPVSRKPHIVLKAYPSIFLVINVMFIFFVARFFIKRYRKSTPFLKKSVLLASAFFICNTGFMVLAAPIALRYMLFSYIILIGFATALAKFRWNEGSDLPGHLTDPADLTDSSAETSHLAGIPPSKERAV